MENVAYSTCIGTIYDSEISKVNVPGSNWEEERIAILDNDWVRISTLSTNDVLREIRSGYYGGYEVDYATLWGHKNATGNLDKFVLTKNGDIGISEGSHVVSLYNPSRIDSNGVLRILARIFMTGGNIEIVGEEREEEPKEEN